MAPPGPGACYAVMVLLAASTLGPSEAGENGNVARRGRAVSLRVPVGAVTRLEARKSLTLLISEAPGTCTSNRR